MNILFVEHSTKVVSLVYMAKICFTWFNVISFELFQFKKVGP